MPLHGAIAGACQIGVALEILLRIGEPGLVGRDSLSGLPDDEPLLRDLLGQRRNGRLPGRDVSARMVECGLVIAWVDAANDVTRLDRLVVIDRNIGDVARDLGADHCRMHVDIGVVGRDEVAARGPIVAAVISAGKDAQGHRQAKRRLL